MQTIQDFAHQQEVPLEEIPADEIVQATPTETPAGMDIEEGKPQLHAKSIGNPMEEFAELEQLNAQGTYKSLSDSERLCDPNIWKRVLREVQDINADFKSLRTTIGVVTDTIGVLHFLMYPADGCMADKPLCGRILIPKEYPTLPPVVHLFTQTNRYNVDVYHSYTRYDRLDYLHSSMCFDILRAKDKYGGIWESEYTLSALIASLLMAIVSIQVLQESGSLVTEYVSMEKLNTVHQSVESTYRSYHATMPARKEIVHLQPMAVQTKYFKLPDRITSNYDQKDLIMKSNPIFLQVPDEMIMSNVYSIGFDLSDLAINPSTVFSLILSNSPYDPIGRKHDTILVRNGITATAAKKRYGRQTEWFYHGKPMNERRLRVIVTIGHNQFCISYEDGDRKAIHGDTPVSFLTPAEIGQVGNQPFYLSVFLKNKGGPRVTVKTFLPDSGYIHPGTYDQ